MPTINCPFCNQSYDVDPETIGQEVQCAVCNETFFAVMPEESIQQPVQQKSVQKRDLLEQEKTVDKVPKQKDYKKVEVHYPSAGTNKCPYCKKDIEPNATTCPYCHNSFYSKNPVKNAIISIIVFVLAYFLISSLVDCEAEHEMNKIYNEMKY